MGVLLNSRDLQKALSKLAEMPGTEAMAELVKVCEPMVEMTSGHFPLYMREDLRQEVRIDLSNRGEALAADVKSGKVRDPMSYIMRMMMNAATDYAKKTHSIECKLVRIDDIQIEFAVYPKTYEKTKLLKKIRIALEHFYKARYPDEEYSERASRFAFIMLSGRRPTLMTNNLQRFFNGNRIAAQMAYTTALVVIRQLLEKHQEEVDCVE